MSIGQKLVNSGGRSTIRDVPTDNVLCSRRIGALQDDLSNSTQRIGKLQETADTTREGTEREEGVVAARHAAELTAATDRAVEAVSTGLGRSV